MDTVKALRKLAPETRLRDVLAFRAAISIGKSENTLIFDMLATKALFRAWEAERPINSFTVVDVAELLRYWREVLGNNNNTIKRRMKWVSVMFDMAIDDGAIDDNPFRSRRAPKVPSVRVERVPFGHEELLRMLKYFQESLTSVDAEMWTSACLVAYHTGLRSSDVVSLRWEPAQDGSGTWVDFTQERIVAHPIKKQNVKQEIEIPLDPELYEHLQHCTAERNPNKPWVNPLLRFHCDNERLFVKRYFRRYCDWAGLPNHSFHSFRHGFVSRLLNAGVHPILIGSMTGQSEATIRQYAHISHAAKANALQQAREGLHKARLQDFRLRIAS